MVYIDYYMIEKILCDIENYYVGRIYDFEEVNLKIKFKK